MNLDWLPAWAAMLPLATCSVGLSLAILPRAKALFIAILWQTRAPGYKPVELVDSTGVSSIVFEIIALSVPLSFAIGIRVG